MPKSKTPSRNKHLLARLFGWQDARIGSAEKAAMRQAAEEIDRLQRTITEAMERLSNGDTEGGARILRECFWKGRTCWVGECVLPRYHLGDHIHSHDWGHVPEGATADRLRDLVEQHFTCKYCHKTVPFHPTDMHPHLHNPRAGAVMPSCMEQPTLSAGAIIAD